jgi:hypothetical protein
MPSALFKREGERWVFNGPLPPSAAEYQGDHARLLVRYMLSLTQPAQAPAPSGTQEGPVASHTPGVAPAPKRQSAARGGVRRGRRAQQVSERRRRLRQARERWRQAASAAAARRSRDFSP